MNGIRTLAAAFIFGLGLASQYANAVPLDFESFPDFFPLTIEIPDLAFSGGTVLTAGVSLNEIDYPPHSGSNVLAALSGSLAISSATPTDHFSAFFTFDEPLRFSVFDLAANLLFSFDSSMTSNLGSTSLIEFSAPTFSSLEIATPGQTAFTVDDLDLRSSQVPEPGSLGLISLAVLLAAWVRRPRSR